jgi:hypothetical protein
MRKQAGSVSFSAIVEAAAIGIGSDGAVLQEARPVAARTAGH